MLVFVHECSSHDVTSKTSKDSLRPLDIYVTPWALYVLGQSVHTNMFSKLF